MDDARTRARLLALQHETLSELSELGLSRDDIVRASQGSNSDDEHDPEGATIAYERSMMQALMTQARLRSSEIALALARLDAGTYESCIVCGSPIGAARLEARPTASRCLRDA